jgi:hypothetical protein
MPEILRKESRPRTYTSMYPSLILRSPLIRVLEGSPALLILKFLHGGADIRANFGFSV